ncbi:hypothetical protein C8035_v012303 [Colletotrichum spinosum]|uniref:Uncharacterized protein n=1 Tax=Colletotrichum spinosum TaxID=1347390 RepID=A0A4R8Q1G6_9PEZI|nr:hypothetical protein C8035_v012303 [Colletotrichum spinosum]
MSSLAPNFEIPRPKSSRAASDASSISTESFTTRRAVSQDSPRPAKRRSSHSQPVNVSIVQMCFPQVTKTSSGNTALHLAHKIGRVDCSAAAAAAIAVADPDHARPRQESAGPTSAPAAPSGPNTLRKNHLSGVSVIILRSCPSVSAVRNLEVDHPMRSHNAQASLGAKE